MSGGPRESDPQSVEGGDPTLSAGLPSSRGVRIGLWIVLFVLVTYLAIVSAQALEQVEADGILGVDQGLLYPIAVVAMLVILTLLAIRSVHKQDTN